jgi:hypothetical protein
VAVEWCPEREHVKLSAPEIKQEERTHVGNKTALFQESRDICVRRREEKIRV